MILLIFLGSANINKIAAQEGKHELIVITQEDLANDVTREALVTMKGLVLGDVLRFGEFDFTATTQFGGTSIMICLDFVRELLEINPELNIEIGIFTDSRGEAETNQLLSRQRAKAMVKILTVQGIDEGKLSYKGYGESELLNKCKDGKKCTDEKHRENRRLEVKIIDIPPIIMD
ncbi:MAG: OmpA family protein [Bacteroidetes bacterium]|nr:OmpA family protein [Bacteroidota bacterium]